MYILGVRSVSYNVLQGLDFLLHFDLFSAKLFYGGLGWECLKIDVRSGGRALQ